MDNKIHGSSPKANAPNFSEKAIKASREQISMSERAASTTQWLTDNTKNVMAGQLNPKELNVTDGKGPSANKTSSSAAKHLFNNKAYNSYLLRNASHLAPMSTAFGSPREAPAA